jgi:hypothetical protein
MGRTYSTQGREAEFIYSILVGKPEGRRSLGRPSYGWKDNIKMDLREIRCSDTDGIDVTEERD